MEQVVSGVDPHKLSATIEVVDRHEKLLESGRCTRLFDTGHNRKTDAQDAHAVAAVAVRTTTLRVLQLDGELEALRMLTDRREALARRRVQTVDRLQALLPELLSGQAKRDLTTGQAKTMLAPVRPLDIAGKTRRRIAAEELRATTAIAARRRP
jgi:transposase